MQASYCAWMRQSFHGIQRVCSLGSVFFVDAASRVVLGLDMGDTQRFPDCSMQALLGSSVQQACGLALAVHRWPVSSAFGAHSHVSLMLEKYPGR